MTTSDKPSVAARDAQQAAAVAAKVATLADQAQVAAGALPPSSTRNLVLKLLAAASAIVGGLMSAGVLPASLAVIPTIIGIVSAALHPSIPAIATFGKGAV